MLRLSSPVRLTSGSSWASSTRTWSRAAARSKPASTTRGWRGSSPSASLQRRRQLAQGADRRELARRPADLLLVVGDRGLQVALGAGEVGDGAGDPALRLGDVGTGQLGHFEALLDAAEIAVQPLQIVLRIADHVARPHHRRIGLDGVQEHGLLGILEPGPGRADLVLGAAGAGHGLAAAVDRLLGHQPPFGLIEHVGIAVGLPVAVERRAELVVDRLVVDGVVAGGADQRSPAGQRLRHLLVGGAQLCPRRIETRVLDIGLAQRVRQRLGRRRDGEAADEEQAGHSRQRGATHGARLYHPPPRATVATGIL